MAKKPKNYRPQQRRPRQESPDQSEPSSDNSGETNRDINEIIDKLADLFEFDSAIQGEAPNTYFGSITAALSGTMNLLDKAGIDTSAEKIERTELEAFIPEIVMAVREAISELRDKGFDVVASHDIIPRLKFQQLFKEMTEHQMGIFNLPVSSLENISAEEITDKMIAALPNLDFEQMSEMNGIQFVAYSRLIRIYGSSRSMARRINEIDTYDFELYDDYRNTALKGLERELESNPNTVRRDTTKALRYIMSDR